MHSLLDDALFTVRLSGQDSTTKLTLPEVFEALHDETLDEFARLSKWQQRPWHCFLTQLDAIMRLQGKGSTIREQLLSLSAGAEEPWRLVVEDQSKAAFMQTAGFDQRPGDGELKPVDYLSRVTQAKNFDVKVSDGQKAVPEFMIYGLVELQTSGGFGGNGLYPASRMYGGYSTRSFITATPSLHPSVWHNRDVEMLLQAANDIDALDDDGPGLLWTLPWDGTKDDGLVIHTLHPLFIEVCRFVRITPELNVLSKSTKGPRLKQEKGDNIDRAVESALWYPIKLDGNSAYSPGPGNVLSYKRLPGLIWGSKGDYELSRGLTFDDGATEKYIVCQVLRRSKTEPDGFFERILKVPTDKTSDLNGGAANTNDLLEEAKARISDANAAEWALQNALSILVDPNAVGEIRKDMSFHYLSTFTTRTDQRFFEDIWDAVDDEELRAKWQQFVGQLAADILQEAEDHIPTRGPKRWQCITKARRFLSNNINKKFLYRVEFNETSNAGIQQPA